MEMHFRIDVQMCSSDRYSLFYELNCYQNANKYNYLFIFCEGQI